MNQEIYYATQNDGKFEEVRYFLEQHDCAIDLKKAPLDLSEIQSFDQKKIALDKARQAWQALKKPVLIDDSGIYFDKYNNFPGAFTKFVYHGIGFEGILKLVDPGDKARFFVQLVYCDSADSYTFFEGECTGTIVKPDKINAHVQLPYDDIFLPDGSDKIYTELRNTPDFIKYSSRVRAMQKFVEWWGNSTN